MRALWARRAPLLALALAQPLASACSSSDTAGPPDDENVTLVVQAPASALLTRDTLQLAVRTVAGDVVPAHEVSWSSDDTAVATVTPDGRVVGVAQGEVTIRVLRGEELGEAAFDVWLGRGPRVPGMASYDRMVPELMRVWGIPGGAVAVVKDGRLVYARGFGLADQEAGEAVQPTSRFRVASISKPITAAAVLRLFEDGLLDLDESAFALLSDLDPPAGATVDPRLADITIRHLLHHAGGWDRDQTFDPMFRSDIAAAAVGVSPPADAETVIRYMLGQPLQFDPGGRYAYSNLGYAVLGRVVERVADVPYEDYVREAVLAPLGAEGMALGGSHLSDRLPREVRYYDPATATSVFPGEGQVPLAYGGFHFEAMDAHGGWVASAVDLLRFVTGVDGRAEPGDLLAPATIALMTAPPPPPLWSGSAFHYGMGWLVRPTGGDANWWHDGSLPGTTALVVRAHDGTAWAALFNRRASGPSGSFAGALDAMLWNAHAAVTAWPDHDLFANLP